MRIMKNLNWAYFLGDSTSLYYMYNRRGSGFFITQKRKVSLLPPANEAWGKVMFLHVSVFLFTAGVCNAT